MPVLFAYKRGEFMTTIEYLALPLYKRIFYKSLAILVSIPKGIGKFFSKVIPAVFKKIGKKIADVFQNIYHNFIDGDWKTKVSYFIMGFGQISRGSILRGLLNLGYQIIFILFMVYFGINALSELPTFGSVASSEYVHPVTGLTIPVYQDDSFDILLLSVMSFGLL